MPHRIWRLIKDGGQWSVTLAGVGLSMWVGVTLGTWIADNDLPIEDLKAVPARPSFQSGTPAVVIFTFNRVRQCGLNAQRYIIDSARTRFALDGVDVDVPGLLGPNVVRDAFDLPPSMAEGRATLVISRAYRCNPLHRLGAPMMAPPLRIEFEVKK